MKVGDIVVYKPIARNKAEQLNFYKIQNINETNIDGKNIEIIIFSKGNVGFTSHTLINESFLQIPTEEEMLQYVTRKIKGNYENY